ncbi:MAG: hypothetical protein Q9192_004005 [Flavoplaca navasiana]
MEPAATVNPVEASAGTKVQNRRSRYCAFDWATVRSIAAPFLRARRRQPRPSRDERDSVREYEQARRSSRALREVRSLRLQEGDSRTAGSRYTDVDVLLLSWEDDDLGVATEIHELDDVFHYVYGYKTKQWKIPSIQSHIALVRRILDSLAESASRDKLSIVNQRPDGATVQWSSIQTTLGQADSDVLILLDCCAAASSVGSPSKGHTEVIGACGFESDSPGVGDHSFTRSLIEELRYYGERTHPLSTAFLFSKILARAKNSWNPRYERNADFERRRTPIHAHLADRSKQRCIELTPMLPLPPRWGRSQSRDTSPPQVSPLTQSPATSTPPPEDVDMSDSADPTPRESSVTSIESQQLLPRVLVSVALEQEKILRTEDWIEWLRSFPALAKWIHIEGAYKSDSNLLLFSLPVALWDMLPKDPAISFVSFVRSRNLLTPKTLPTKQLSTGASRPEASNISNANVALDDGLLDPAQSKSKLSMRKTSNKGLATTLGGSSESLKLVSEADPELRQTFKMLLHLAGNDFAQRVALIDTAGDADVISMQTVDSLGLRKERYEGGPIGAGISAFKPQWQKTFDWHVAGFSKTYTSTFLVLEEAHSGDFDILIGGHTIGRIGFYQKRADIW